MTGTSQKDMYRAKRDHEHHLNRQYVNNKRKWVPPIYQGKLFNQLNQIYSNETSHGLSQRGF